MRRGQARKAEEEEEEVGMGARRACHGVADVSRDFLLFMVAYTYFVVSCYAYI